MCKTSSCIVFCSGQGEFVENGAENHFEVNGTPVLIKSFSSGNKRKGMLYTLKINDKELEPVVEIRPPQSDRT